MNYTPVTPFGRPVEAVHVTQILDQTNQELQSKVNKWEALRELSTARKTYGLSDRDLNVLQALISFHKEVNLDGQDPNLVVYPSNKAICERLNGMPCSTMRRHLSHLISAGIIIRRDSPNGKRYARQYGDEKIAFGFDLRPLAQRFLEFCATAETIRAEQFRYKRLRENVVLMRRDLAGLIEYGQEKHPRLSIWKHIEEQITTIAKQLRRKLSIDALQDLEAALLQHLNQARERIDPDESEKLSSNEPQNEQHHQNSNKDKYELKEATNEKLCEKKPDTNDEKINRQEKKLPNISLRMIVDACKEVQSYLTEPIRHWHDLVRGAETIRPMMGISPTAWTNAKHAMGTEQASVVVIAMLERFHEIRSPGGYLHCLTSKASNGTFSCGPMIISLIRRTAKCH